MLLLVGVSGCTSQDWSHLASALDESNRGSAGYQPVCPWENVTDSKSSDGINAYYEGICSTDYLTVSNTTGTDFDCEIDFSGRVYNRRLPPYGKVELEQAGSDSYSFGWHCRGRR